MRKLKLAIVLLFVVFILGGCSGASLPFKRIQDAEKDEIKFYGFEWLTEAKVIMDKFNKDFGKDSYTIQEKVFPANPRTYDMNSPVKRYQYMITGKDNENLLWNMGGHELKEVQLSFLSADDGKHCYLVWGDYLFDYSEEVFEDLSSKLQSKYSGNNNRFSDDNKNQISLSNNNGIIYVRYALNATEFVRMVEEYENANYKKNEITESPNTDMTGL